MKQKLLLVLLLIYSVISAQEVTHVDFDTNNANIVFNSWNTSSTFAKVANPASDATNPSAFVGQFTAGADNGIGIGVIDATTVFASPFNLASNSVFKMKVFATEEIEVIFHLENSPDWGNNIEAKASVGSSDINKWTELTFDFSSFSNIYMNNIVIKIGGANTTSGDIYFFDDIKGPALYTNPAQVYNPANNATDASIAANLEIATNGKFRKLDDAELTDVTSVVALKIGDENGADVAFSATINGDKNKITINPTNDLSNSTTYWYGIVDNSIEYSNDSPVTGVSASFTTKAAVTGDINEFLFDFDTTNPDVGFVSWAGTGFAKIANPDPTGINVSANVGEYTHAGNDSGLENDLVDNASPLTPLDFSETPFIKVKVWVSKPVNVTVRIQNYPDYGQGEEKVLNVTETNKWVELIFNYSSTTATNYNRAQIYFDRDKSGGSVAGDTYYFDDYLKSNIPPAVSNTLSPVRNATDVSLISIPTITSNFQFRNIDNSTITDISSFVELRENDATGTLVAINALLSSNGSVITLHPAEMLKPNTTYWYGIKDDVIEYKESNSLVSGISATFTTTANTLNLVTYNDFEGTSLTMVSESMGDPAAPYETVADPTGGANRVQKWTKGNSWGGWERIHFELDAPFDATKDDVFSFRVYSPITTNYMFKLADAKDDGDQNASLEKWGDFLIANQWQTIYVDASELADGVNFNHLFVFIGPGNGSVTGNFYIDDLQGPQLQGAASVQYFEKVGFNFYPNPAGDMIRFSNLDGKKELKIFDINAKQILKKIISNTDEVSIKELKPGFYFMEIDGQHRKLIKK
ncbi:Ig-like domain-containing protein [uncultured Polaribacter sp.]|uniref:Ig-like domain-containing protein n=1 Tax=uncultured Polaribacter sp. TaxID=174711 RepID=UPI0030DD6707|tara:strand:- start:19351 stop:21783 length:2433 start_codon:yes stop_codon:yes gene_type:complete